MINVFSFHVVCQYERATKFLKQGQLCGKRIFGFNSPPLLYSLHYMKDCLGFEKPFRKKHCFVKLLQDLLIKATNTFKSLNF